MKAYIVQLEGLVKQLIKRQDELEKRTEKLEAQSKMNSHNSSKPPSLDSPFKCIVIRNRKMQVWPDIIDIQAK